MDNSFNIQIVEGKARIGLCVYMALARHFTWRVHRDSCGYYHYPYLIILWIGHLTIVLDQVISNVRTSSDGWILYSSVTNFYANIEFVGLQSCVLNVLLVLICELRVNNSWNRRHHLLQVSLIARCGMFLQWIWVLLPKVVLAIC